MKCGPTAERLRWFERGPLLALRRAGRRKDPAHRLEERPCGRVRPHARRMWSDNHPGHRRAARRPFALEPLGALEAL